MYRYPSQTPLPAQTAARADAPPSGESELARPAAPRTSRFLGVLAGIGVFLSLGMAAPAPCGGAESAGEAVSSSTEEVWDATEATFTHTPSYGTYAGPNPGCDDLARLQPLGLLGKLTSEQTRCLQQTLATAEGEIDPAEVSLLLIANAYAQADASTWEGLVHRHLVEIDGSDADLAYAYALHLSRKGASRAHGAIHWSEVALSKRTAWTRDTYQSRVNALYRVRAEAARELWLASEAAHVSAPTVGGTELVAYRRSRADAFARAWLQYARAAGQGTRRAHHLCTSAAGPEAPCSAL